MVRAYARGRGRGRITVYSGHRRYDSVRLALAGTLRVGFDVSISIRIPVA
jgi:hypothetical protein